MEVYKIVLVGAMGCGKTSFVKGAQGHGNNHMYIKTIGVDVEPITFDDFPVMCNIWDCAGDLNVAGLGSGYYKESHACIVMFDALNPETIPQSCSFIPAFREVCPEAPIFYVATKCDRSNLPHDFPKNIYKCSSYAPITCKNVMKSILNRLATNEEMLDELESPMQ